MSGSLTGMLEQLAKLYGIQTAFRDMLGRRIGASQEGLLAALKCLGAPVEGMQDVASALRERRQALWRRRAEPVVAVAAGRRATFEARVTSAQARGRLRGHLRLENGEQRELSWLLGGLRAARGATVEGVRYVARRLGLPALPPGYHRLTLEWAEGPQEVLVIASPGRAFLPRNGRAAGRWGVFAPLYALRRADDWGVGDFSSLGRLAEWVAGRRGGVVGTLPLLASFLDRPFEPSPYVPVSRLFWNELFLDVGRLPEFAACPEAQRLTASSDMRQELQALRSAPLVEYARAMALKRRALEVLARWFFTSGSPERRAAYERFLGEHEAAEDYARFRAACQRLGAPWTRWPEGPRTGQLQEIDGDPEIVRYHLYVQWACDEQMRAAAQAARCGGVDLYLDLPLGVHPDGYDAWRHREVFAQGCCAGAPPDPVFASGQDWGFPPLHPERLREQRYAYYIACLRHHLRYGGMLRLDHVMSLHRLFWVPRGLGATHGVYVRYRHEQLYAILCLESLRHRAVIVGENLGTVPPQVHRALPRHGIQGMFVVEYELSTSRRRPLRRVPRDVVASLNTHDIPPFAAYWQGLDLGVRVRLGLLSREAARGEADVRQGIRDALVRLLRREGLLTDDATSPADVVRACLAHLGRSRARAVLVNLEDLWLEVQPQNIPGTSAGEPNWRRKLRHDLDALEGVPELLALMRDMARLRGGTAP